MPTKRENLELKQLEVDIRRSTAQAEQAELELKLVRSRPQAKGVFTFIGQVGEVSVHVLMEKMDIWSNAHPGEPITLTINSQGGSVLDGMAFFDYLRTLQKRGHKLTTVGIGLVASMAGVLLQAGEERVMTPRAWLLVHEVQGITAGSFAEMEDDMKFNERLQTQVLDVLMERSTWSRRKLQSKWKRKDCWLSAEEALEAGLIDRIEDI